MATSANDSTSSASTSTEDSTDDTAESGLPTSSESTDDTADTGNVACGEAGSCGEPAPPGWFGPMVYARVDAGETPPSCPAEIGTAGPTVVDGFVDPGPAQCSCACESSGALNCSGVLVTDDGGSYGMDDGNFIEPEPMTSGYGTDSGYGGTDGYGSGVMTGYGGTGYGSTGYYGTTGYDTGGNYCGYYGGSVSESCTNMALAGSVRFSSYEGYYGGGVVCEETNSEVIPPFAWPTSLVTCRIPETTPPCEDGVCLPPIPEGFEAKWCIYQQGDLDCPAEYPDKAVFWSGVEDTRECTGCSCGAPASCEDVELFVYGEEDCAGVPVAVLPANGECTEVVGASFNADTGGEGCPVTEESVPQGAIAPTGPFTFCCGE